MAKVLVTGYGGFLGQAVVQQLLSAGHAVHGLSRTRKDSADQHRVQIFQGDVADPAAVNAAMVGCDAVIHTAAKAGVWGPWQEYFEPNVIGTQNILSAARSNAVKAVVYTSSPSVTFSGENQSGVDESAPYPRRWLCHYPHTKAIGERAVIDAAEAGQLQTCSLRPHLIWGSGDPHLFPRVVQRARAGKLRRLGAGTNLIDTVHVQHAAEAHMQALVRLLDGDSAVNGKSFFITDGQPIECWQWITRILETAGLPVPDRSIPYPLAYRLGACLEAVFWITRNRREPPMTRFVASQLALDHYFSINLARELLSYQPHLDRDVELDGCRAFLRHLSRDDR